MLSEDGKVPIPSRNQGSPGPALTQIMPPAHHRTSSADRGSRAATRMWLSCPPTGGLGAEAAARHPDRTSVM